MPFPSFASVHAFCHRTLFYPLALSTLLCAVLIVGRVVVSDTYGYRFLVWNLFLAWLPYAFAVGVVLVRRRRPGRWWACVGLAALWALFLPNAPYIVTDFKHLLHLRPFPIMYDIVLIFAFAWTGLLLGIVSLYLLQTLVRDQWGAVAAAAFVVATALMTGVGVYVGRFLRWNSWDVLTRPATLVRTTLDAALNPLDHTHALAHSLVFATATLACYLTFLTLRRESRE
jgi:uncharacterized membrane protein